MQLVSMEVNRTGSQDRLQLGPLSHGLNALCGPNGSGKTTLLKWLRDMVAQEPHSRDGLHRDHLVSSTYVPAMNGHAPLMGQLQLRNGGNTTTLRQSVDGRVQRQNHATDIASALTTEQQRAFAELTGIHHAVDNISRLESLARQLEIDKPRQSHWQSDRHALLTRQNEIHLRLRSLEGLRSTRESLLARRGHLEAELHRARKEGRGRSGLSERERLEDRRNALATELRDVRAEIVALERDIAGHKSGWPLRRAHHELNIGATYREQLEQLDARLDRWRQTLRDLRAHRERLEHSATDARLDKQIGDQLSVTKTADPRGALRSLEAQILSASRQLDTLVDRYDRSYEACSTHQSLPETLRSMQRDLYEVCQQLARHESTASAETLRQQAAQLARCEAELLQSVEKLIEQRALLLRKIADEYHLSMDQLTLAFGDWCECHDHPHLSQWLLNEAPGDYRRNLPDQPASEFYSEEMRLWETRRGALQARADEVQAELKDVESQLVSRRHPQAVQPIRPENEILQELDKVNAELSSLEERDHLRVELDELRRSLAKLPIENVAADRFRQLVNKHVDALMGHQLGWRSESRARMNEFHLPVSYVSAPTYYNGERTVSANGNYVDRRRPGQTTAPTSIVELAMRLAIVEVLAERGNPISLVVDGPLDHLAPELQQAAVRHLDDVARTGQQIVVLSSDERIADLVRSSRGWVGYLRNWSTVRPVAPQAHDVNRQLLAYANDFEADKWQEPVVPSQRIESTRSHYLSERSLIEECPSLDATCSARCRALGIDRVGDLLATDPHWLAEHLRIHGVTSSTVMRWQAEARLLCSVRQLRPFDARVLAGAGVRHPRQLAEMHPSQLLDRVERFLTTDRGREILRSGNSYELSRITAWIASAKNGEPRARVVAPRTADYSDWEDGDREQSFASDRYEAIPNGFHREPTPRQRFDDTERQQRRDLRRSERRPIERSYPVVNREPEQNTEFHRDERSGTSRQPRVVRDKSRTGRDDLGAKRGAKNGRTESTNGWRYYLDLASPVVDAPSIGPKVADKLASIGIRTVEQFLNANAESIANRLETRRVDSTVIRAWQDQAKLVCRVPNLRGHDAQLLVACKIVSPEELARAHAATLLSQVSSVAQSTEGQRILRGSQAPDLAEVNDWIKWAGNSRALNAA